VEKSWRGNLSKEFDLTSAVFGRLTVTGRAPDRFNKDGTKNRMYYWLCKCSCGKEVSIAGTCLRRRNRQSCGCKHKEDMLGNTMSRVHGLSNTRLHRIWNGMHRRCYMENHDAYHNYGGRGIKVCKDWHTFINFYNDMIASYKNDRTLDRIDNDGDYTKDNCKWSTDKEQSRNRRTNVHYEFNGERLILQDIVKKYSKLAYPTVWRRIKKYGMSLKDALVKPLHHSASTKADASSGQPTA